MRLTVYARFALTIFFAANHCRLSTRPSALSTKPAVARTCIAISNLVPLFFFVKDYLQPTIQRQHE